MFKKLLGITLTFILLIGLTACGVSKEANNDSASIGEKLDYTIVGIGPGAGIMEMTINNVLPEYGLDDKWEVQESSGAAMTAELGSAIENEEPIIVTGWIPHWKFFKYDLKMLDDPKEAFGGKEDINTLVRKGLKDGEVAACRRTNYSDRQLLVAKAKKIGNRKIV